MPVAVNPYTQQLVETSQQQGLVDPNAATPNSGQTTQMLAPQTGSPVDALNQYIVGSKQQAAEQAMNAKAENAKQAKLAASTAWYNKQVNNPNSKQGKFLRETYGTDLEKLIGTGVLDITKMQNAYAQHSMALAREGRATAKENARLLKYWEQVKIARPELNTPEMNKAIALDPRNVMELLGMAKQDLTSNKGIASKAIQKRPAFDRAWQSKGLDDKLNFLADRYLDSEVKNNPHAVAQIKKEIKDAVYTSAARQQGMVDLFALTESVIAEKQGAHNRINFNGGSGFARAQDGSVVDFAKPTPELEAKIQDYTDRIRFSKNMPELQAREEAIAAIKSELDLGAKEQYGTIGQAIAPIAGAAQDIRDYFTQ